MKIRQHFVTKQSRKALTLFGAVCVQSSWLDKVKHRWCKWTNEMCSIIFDTVFPGCQIGILVSLTFSIVATAVLSDLWSKEWTTLLLSFQVTLLFLLLLHCSQCGFLADTWLVLFSDQVTAPYLHVGGVLLMTALSWPIALHFFRMRSRGEVHVLFCSEVQSLKKCSFANY